MASGSSDGNNDKTGAVISLLDQFIEKIHSLRRVMFGMSISALVMAPFAVIVSLYLATHHHFLVVVENENEFGIALVMLISIVIIISGVWFYTGIRQFKVLSRWDKRYRRYVKKRKQAEDEIFAEYDLGQDS